MAWVIVQFSDLTVSCVPKKWLTKVKKVKMCYYPKSGASWKIKAAVDVDKKSKKFKLYPYRLLMDGEEFATYVLARKAEIIAQTHSTIKSFEESYDAKQQSRKRPIVHFGSSSPSSTSGSESQDFKNIKTLSKIDAGLALDSEKVYDYSKHSGNANFSDEKLFNSDDGQSSENEENECLDKSASGDNDEYCSEDDIDNSSIEDDNNFSYKGDDNSSNGGKNSFNEESNSSSDDGNSSKEDDNKRIRISSQMEFPLESTNLAHQDVIISPTDSGYNDFRAERRLPHIERAVMSACQQLQENGAMLKEIRENSRETKSLVQSFIPIIKDLAAEVFDSKEEIKKRNGLFTDVLTPKIQLSIKNVKQYGDAETELEKHKITDNMIKYLGCTINESDEKKFIKSCLTVVFKTKFLLKKVWWKTMPGKVNIKKSKILHCIRENFKAKFGLVEPKRSDKDVNKLIYKTCRNMKDNERKSIKAMEKQMEKTKQESKLDQRAEEKGNSKRIGEANQDDENERKRIKKTNEKELKKLQKKLNEKPTKPRKMKVEILGTVKLD